MPLKYQRLSFPGGTITVNSQQNDTLSYNYQPSSGSTQNGTISMISPVLITNTNTAVNTQLTVQINCNITINTSNFWFAISPGVTFDGGATTTNTKTIRFNRVINYPGLLQQNTIFFPNFQFPTGYTLKTNVQNVTVGLVNEVTNSTLSVGSGWIVGAAFGYFSNSSISTNVTNVTNCTNYYDSNATFGGGIAGSYFAAYLQFLGINSCTNYGRIQSDYAGGVAGAYYGYNSGSGSGGSGSNSNTNYGAINGRASGGIVGAYAFENAKSVANYMNLNANNGTLSTNTFDTYGGIIAGYGFNSNNCSMSQNTPSNSTTNPWFQYGVTLSNAQTLSLTDVLNEQTKLAPITTKYKTTTTMSTNTRAGSRFIETNSNVGIETQDIAFVTNAKETGEIPSIYQAVTVERPGSIYIYEALKNSYPAGSLIYIYPPNTTLSEILAEQNLPIPIADICFVKYTPIETDQGVVLIQKIDPKIHTINNKKIIAITKSVTEDKFLVCFEKHALGKNIPSTRTIVSKYHKIQNEHGEMIGAHEYVENFENVKKIDYNDEILYNILMEEHETVNVNNLICETLHPEHVIAKLYTSKYRQEDKNKIIVLMNYCKKLNNMQTYQKIVDRLSISNA